MKSLFAKPVFWVVIAVAAAFLIFVPSHISPYVLNVLILVCLWGTIANGFDIMGGYAGQICFIPPLFTGIGAYLSTWLLLQFNVSPWIGMFVAALATMVIALGIGYVFFRYGLRDVYFALGTMALVLIAQTIFLNLPTFGGAEGLFIIVTESNPWMMKFVDKAPYFYIAFFILVGVTLVKYLISRSKIGYWFLAIRENQEAAEAIGVNVMRYKQYATAISAFLLAIAGTFWAQYVTYIDPYTAFYWEIAGLAIIIMVAGGNSTVLGPLLGAAVLVPTTEYVRAAMGQQYPGAHMVVYGVILMLIVLYMPNGLLGFVLQYSRKWFPVKETGADKTRSVPELVFGTVGSQALAPTQAGVGGLTLASEPAAQSRPAASPAQPRGAAAPILLQVQGITKRFGGLTAVNNFSVDVYAGEVLGIIGPNGAGKTTTFHMLSGFYKPDDGKVIFQGKDVTGLLPHRICEAGLARTFQVIQPFPKLTVLETVMVGAFLRFTKREEAERHARMILSLVGMTDRADVLTSNLTLADLKRTEVAKALATNPKVLLLDEVMAGLTDVEVDELIVLLRAIRKQTGITFVIIEHVMKAVMSFCERVIVLDYGVKLAEGTPEQVVSDPKVIEAYLGASEEVRCA